MNKHIAILLFLVLLWSASSSAGTPLSGGALSIAGDPIDKIWRLFKTDLERDTPDTFDIKLLIRGELGGEEALMSAVRRGRINMGSFTVSAMSSIVPEFSLVMAPYMFQSYAELDFVLDHYLSEPFSRMATDRGLYILGWLDGGWINLYAKDPIIRPGDLVGYPMRAWQVPTSHLFFETLGADTVVMPFPDLIPSLQTGLVRGSEIGPMTYDGIGMAEHAPHYVLTQHAYNTGVFAVNKMWFDSLKESERAAIVAAVPDKRLARALLRDGVSKYYESMLAQGAIIHKLTDAERAQWVKASLPTHDVLLEELGSRARALYDIIDVGKLAFAEINR